MSLLRRYTALLFFFLLGALHSLSFAAQPLPTAVLPYVQLITLTLLIYQLNIRPTARARLAPAFFFALGNFLRSEEHTSELQSRGHLVCRLLLEKKKHELA